MHEPQLVRGPDARRDTLEGEGCSPVPTVASTGFSILRDGATLWRSLTDSVRSGTAACQVIRSTVGFGGFFHIFAAANDTTASYARFYLYVEVSLLCNLHVMRCVHPLVAAHAHRNDEWSPALPTHEPEAELSSDSGRRS